MVETKHNTASITICSGTAYFIVHMGGVCQLKRDLKCISFGLIWSSM